MKTAATMFGQPCKFGRNHGGAGTLGMIDEHYTFAFDNGWGASVIRGQASFGSWELAVIGKDGKINYDHPVSQGDVVRGDESEITAWLELIRTTPADADLATLKDAGL